ncbi:MAG: N-acetyl-gamma-glutamyl-phosphate reductase [Gammaproteobacteria bacterium]|nr:N-acetyl-gamma-glutamyl-phosphate reductase [Gammaproteobacteria bacterium]
MEQKYTIGIVGGTGYTGVELLRILAGHPHVTVKMITSRSEKGVRLDDMFPSLRGVYDLAFEDIDLDALKQCDLVFFATPNGVAMNYVKELVSAGVKVIDLAADFRIKDLSVWSKWYGMEHAAPEIVEQAVYGLPEIYREQIKTAQVIANPGCYATAVQLGFIPLVESGLVDVNHLIANVASGVSGAGKGASVATLYSEVNESYKAYAAQGHRHQPEIKQQLDSLSETPVKLTFVPHLIPMTRGIHATLYATDVKNKTAEQVQEIFAQRYQNEPFVDVLPVGDYPETRSVKGGNICRISVLKPQDEEIIVVLCVIDNLVKGAAGQAVQNMNLMLGFEETLGLTAAPLVP